MNALAILQGWGLSVRLNESKDIVLSGLKSLSSDEREIAIGFCREYKPEIVERVAALAHARRMLVDCPATGGKRHCWHCSRCPDTSSCMAWRVRRSDVEFFRQSEKPYSLSLVEVEVEEQEARVPLARFSDVVQ
jgi:hypothetical protein